MENISGIKNYQKLVFENLNKCHDIEMVIVKGHIIIEHHINRFISASIKNPGEYDDTKFIFSQKIQLSFMLGLITDLKEELNLINKLRNEIAHKLSYNENHLSTGEFGAY